MSLLSTAGPPATVALQTVRSRSVVAYERLDAHFFVSPGVAAAERIALTVTVHQGVGDPF